MIQRLSFLRNVGHFEAVTAGAQIPLARVALLYAENGRGKTTLTAVLRSLASGNALPIAERRRLGTNDAPHVVVECTGGPPHAIFQNGAWNRNVPGIVVFDDAFVAENVCAGLSVGAEQRQNLHELILGAQGVQLNRGLKLLIDQIENHNGTLRVRADAIPPAERRGYTVDQFCGLTAQANIDVAIAAAERNLAAGREQEPIRLQSAFSAFSIPTVDMAAVVALLNRQLADLQAAAAERVREHLATLGRGGEGWVAEGMRRITEPLATAHCPFCAQGVAGSSVIPHYEAYFSDAYDQLKQTIASAIGAFETEHSGDAIAAFERSVRIASERRTFWARFCEVPEVNLDTAMIAQSWQRARDSVLTALRQKANTPLERIELDQAAQTAISDYQNHCDQVAGLSQRLTTANATITGVKQGAAGANTVTLASELSRLQAIQARHSAATSVLCAAYTAEKAAKAATEAQRDAARLALENYRTAIFPAYQAGVNQYLELFQASYRLANVQPSNQRVGSTCNYQVIINNTPVAVGANEPPTGQPTFRTALSAGDRNTLALAFFFASLDRDPNRANAIVVIDDPVSSLDEHRTLTTVQHLRRLATEVAQLIVLSHSKSFLCRIWENADTANRCAVQVSRNPTGSSLIVWDANQDSITEHDRRHAKLRQFSGGHIQASREIAQAIRPTLEAFLRVSFPEVYTPGTLLGPFRNTCQQRLGRPNEILSAQDVQDLQDITEYANRFHHDTNPAWDTAAVNDAELLQFTNRALRFARR